MFRVGIDTGGTFTDLVAIEEDTGEVLVAKRPSTPGAPEQAVLEVLDASGVPPGEIERIALGTTIAANTRLVGSGATVIYVATAGFEDIPIIGSISRPHAYDPSWIKPDPGVRRRSCVGVVERVDKRGNVLIPLETAEVNRALDEIDKVASRLEGEELSIAVNLIFSYLAPEHERTLGAAIRDRFPDTPVSLSHEVAPIWREHPRSTTTILGASVKPTLLSFATALERELDARAVEAPLSIMKSNGGQMLARAAPERAAEIFLSGLAGGVIGGHFFAGIAGSSNAVTLDMGGTSTDVGLIVDARYGARAQYDLDWGISVVAAHIDFTCIGAGGGSIASVDESGLLQVGPASAGADPGPVCYGAGGTQPTVTDANLVLGRLDPEFFLGGEMDLELDAAEAALAKLGKQIGLGPQEAALALIATVNDNMASAVRKVTIDRGLDYRDFDLVAFGGAGPLHAADVAHSMGLRSSIIPLHPGLCSAFGTALADVRVDKSRTVHFRSDSLAGDDLTEIYHELEAQATLEISDEGYSGTPVFTRSAAVRYVLQSHEIEIPVPGESLGASAVDDFVASFHREHQDRFGFSTPGHTLEITRVTVTALGEVPRPELSSPSGELGPEPARHRDVWFGPEGPLATPIYFRQQLGEGATIDGPAIVEEPDSTTLVGLGQQLRVVSRGVLQVQPSAGRREASALARKAQAPEKDHVTLNVVNNRLRSICDEMVTTTLRTAHSPLFSESLDFTCMLFNRDRELISQAEMNPAIICAGLTTVPFVVEELGLDFFEPGDVIVHNDPYRGSCHMPEHLLLKPIFHQDELVGFSANIAHVAEIGGMAPGSFAATATEVFQEGLRLPPVKLIRRGEYVKDVWRLILANHRTPDASWGDFHAMIASLDVGEQRLVSLLDEHGLEAFTAVTKELIASAERWVRARIRQIPDGNYTFEDCMEDDGVVDRPLFFRADVEVSGDEVLVDFSASDKQALGPVNLTYVATSAATYAGILQSINAKDVPLNQGSFRPISIVAPPGSVLNVAYPGPSVGGNSEGQPRVINVIWGAMAQAMPDRASAADGGTACLFPIAGVHPDTGDYYATLLLEGGGWGARADTDGNHSLFVAHGSTIQLTPIEVLESRYPIVHVEYSLRDGSGGAGLSRGGLGTRRVFRVPAPEMTVGAFADRSKVSPWGIFGGGPARTQAFRVKRVGESAFRSFSEVFGTVSDTKFINITLYEGDEVMIESPGGGGYGPPEARDAERVLNDVHDRLIDVESARDDYCVALQEINGDLRIDREATAELRTRSDAAH